MLRGSICRLRVVALVFRKPCADVTHPPPLSRGEIWILFFFLVMRGVSGAVSPLERGFKGCVTVRGAAGDEELRDTVSGMMAVKYKELNNRLFL